MYLCRRKTCDSGSVGRALASQAEGRGFESRLSLQASHEHKLASPHNIFPTAFQGNPKKSVTFAVGFADMAQLVEQRIRNAWVGGSSPPIGSRQEKRGTFLSFFVYHAEHCKNLGSPDKPRGLSIQPCKSEKEEPYIRHSSQGRSECLYLRIE